MSRHRARGEIHEQCKALASPEHPLKRSGVRGLRAYNIGESVIPRSVVRSCSLHGFMLQANTVDDTPNPVPPRYKSEGGTSLHREARGNGTLRDFTSNDKARQDHFVEDGVIGWRN